MPTLAVWLGIIAAFLFRQANRHALFWASVGTAAVGFISWQIMKRAATMSAARRRETHVDQMRYEERTAAEIATVESLPLQLSLEDTQQAPNWATVLNLLSALASIILVVWAVVARFA